jgi:HAD superfamily hydrolase (TIGR01484 family)
MLLVRNLLLDFTGMLALLREQLTAARDSDPDEVLDAFLLAAGANQIVEDHLHREVLALGKLGSVLPAGAAAVARTLETIGIAARSITPRERSLSSRQRHLAALTNRLADAVAAGAETGLLHLQPETRVPAELARSIVRLPNCFRSFDQHPDDCRRLAELYSERGEDRGRPLLVLGLRTSGSYLAPLTASFLRLLGHRQVETMTFRPGRPWLAGERRRLRSHARAGGAVLVIDDPPRTGVQLRRAADELRKLGVSRSSIALLVPTLGPELPEPLRGLDVVELPWERWSVQERLDNSAVAEALATLRGRPPRSVQLLELHTREAAAERSHASALFTVDGDERLLVRGVGLGYLGRHALFLGEALTDYLPRIHGFGDGLLYREWLPEEDRLQLERATDRPVVMRLAAYAAARAERLAVDNDASERLLGRDALWEHVGALLGRAFGKLRLPLRPALHRTAKQLLHVPNPAVPDGSMHVRSWFEGPAMLKVDFEERSFAASGLTLYNFDPAFDLATASTDSGEELARLLLAEYETLAGTRVSRERWLLYRLLRLHIAYRGARREGGGDTAACLLAHEQAMARAHRRYMSDLFFADVEAPTSGRLCAIDIDGVLETRWLPYPAIGPAGATAIRALIRHGFRPVLVTGRSLDDVSERCAAYRIPAGVAEYGAVLWDQAASSAVPLMTESARADLESLRAALLSMSGTYVDPGYHHGVRAYDAASNGGLEPAVARRATAEAGVADLVRTIDGELQTDFAPAGVDKGTGLAALQQLLGADADVALAVGDSASDLPMLALAERKFAPANATAELRALPGLRVTRAPYQAGLASAVGSLLGHRPGRCELCRPPRFSTDTQLLMLVLAAQDASRWSKLRHGLALARLARRAA